MNRLSALIRTVLGTHVQAWGDDREIHVKVGGKSTRYTVVQAQ